MIKTGSIYISIDKWIPRNYSITELHRVKVNSTYRIRYLRRTTKIKNIRTIKESNGIIVPQFKIFINSIVTHSSVSLSTIKLYVSFTE